MEIPFLLSHSLARKGIRLVIPIPQGEESLLRWEIMLIGVACFRFGWIQRFLFPSLRSLSRNNMRLVIPDPLCEESLLCWVNMFVIVDKIHCW